MKPPAAKGKRDDLFKGRDDRSLESLESPASIGRNCNLAFEQAAREFIAQGEDNDWYASDRLPTMSRRSSVVMRDVTDMENAFVLELLKGVFWTTHPEPHKRMLVGDVHGGTLVYRKTLFVDSIHYAM